MSKQSVGDLAIVISGNAGPALASFDQASKGLASFASRVASVAGLGGAGGALAGPMGMLAGVAAGGTMAALNLASAAVSSLASAVVSAGESAVRSAVQFEAQSTALGVMVGGAEKGKALMGELQALAVATPFGSSDLADAAQSMLGMGLAAENVVPTLSRIGDIAAGDVEKLKRLTMAFGQVQAKGRLMGDEVLQFAEAGVGIDAFARAAGMSMEKFRSEMEAGRISADVMVRAVNNLTSEGGRFYRMNAKASQTVRGAWNGLTETLEVAAQKVGTAVFEKLDLAGRLSRAADALAPLAGWIAGPIAEGFDLAARAADSAFTMIASVAEAAWPALKAVGKSVLELLPSFESMRAVASAAFKTVTYGVLKVIDSLAHFARYLLNAGSVGLRVFGWVTGIPTEGLRAALDKMANAAGGLDLAGDAMRRFDQATRDAGKSATKTATEVAKIAEAGGASAAARQAAAAAQKSFDKGSALQEYTRTTDALRDALLHSLINEDVLIQGVGDAFDKLAKDVGHTFETKIPELMERGSREAENAIMRAVESTRGDDPQKRVEEVLKRAYEQEKRTAVNTDRIYKAVRDSWKHQAKAVKIG